MNKAVPVALALLVVGVLAVEGKWSALWKAITTQGQSSPSNPTNQSGGTVPNISGGSGNASVQSSSTQGELNNSGANGTNTAVNAVSDTANLLAQRLYAVNNGTDPVLNDYFAKRAITSDPTLNANWHSFIQCYLTGADTNACASMWLPKG